MEMCVVGMVFGFVMGFILFWNRTRSLEDELLRAYDEITRLRRKRVRRNKAQNRRFEEWSCESRNLFKEF